MKFLTLTVLTLILLASCGKNNSSSSGSKIKNYANAGTYSITSMKNEGVYFTLIRHPYYSDISWIEIRCQYVAGKSNDHKAKVLMNFFESNQRVFIEGKRLSSYQTQNMVNEALRSLEWQPHSTQCPELVLASENNW